MTEIARRVEALLFLSPDPLALDVLADLADADRETARAALEELAARHDEASGLEVAEIAGGYVLRTRADLEQVCDRLRQRPPEDRLSPAALETLAVVAYLEPVSRPDIGRLRGVAVDSTVASLVERGLLEEAGRVASTGAMRYRTTRAFQERFGLRDAGDLPRMERFELTGPQAEELRRRLVESGHLGPSGPTPVTGHGAAPADRGASDDMEPAAPDAVAEDAAAPVEGDTEE